MLGEPIRKFMERRKVLMAAPDTKVSAAAKRMVKRKASAVMVVQDGRLVGLFTEHDAIHRVIAKGRDPLATSLAEVMTVEPRTLSPDESFGYAMLMMYEQGFRHVPVVENGRPVGIVSSRHALDPELEEFAVEANRRRHIRRYARGVNRISAVRK
jgi:CBS domain-containing protein